MLIVFDMNGTLTDPSGIGEPWGVPELGLEVLASAIESAMVDTITGRYRPLREHVRASIVRHATLRGLDLDRVDDAAQRASALDPWPDAAPALDMLRDGGHRLAVLTNSGAEGGEATLRGGGLLDRFERVLGVDAVERFKPHPAVYEHALSELRVRPEEAMLVAAHGWDVTGAKRVGLRTTWIARGEGELHPAAEPPDVRAADLLDAARQLTSA